MRVKINGRDLNPGDRVTFESSSYTDAQGMAVMLSGLGMVVFLLKHWGWF